MNMMKNLDFDGDKGNPSDSLSLSLSQIDISYLVKVHFPVLAKEFLSNFADATGEAKYMNLLVRPPPSRTFLCVKFGSPTI